MNNMINHQTKMAKELQRLKDPASLKVFSPVFFLTLLLFFTIAIIVFYLMALLNGMGSYSHELALLFGILVSACAGGLLWFIANHNISNFHLQLEKITEESLMVNIRSKSGKQVIFTTEAMIWSEKLQVLPYSSENSHLVQFSYDNKTHNLYFIEKSKRVMNYYSIALSDDLSAHMVEELTYDLNNRLGTLRVTKPTNEKIKKSEPCHVERCIEFEISRLQKSIHHFFVFPPLLQLFLGVFCAGPFLILGFHFTSRLIRGVYSMKAFSEMLAVSAAISVFCFFSGLLLQWIFVKRRSNKLIHVLSLISEKDIVFMYTDEKFGLTLFTHNGFLIEKIKPYHDYTEYFDGITSFRYLQEDHSIVYNYKMGSHLHSESLDLPASFPVSSVTASVTTLNESVKQICLTNQGKQ